MPRGVFLSSPRRMIARIVLPAAVVEDRCVTVGEEAWQSALRGLLKAIRPLVGTALLVLPSRADSAIAMRVTAVADKGCRGSDHEPDWLQLAVTRAPADGSDSLSKSAGAGAAWLSAKDVGALHANMVDVICAGVTVSEEPEPSGGAGATLDAAESFLECTRTDRSDGLLPTVVCDRAGVALGLVYSNHASVRVSIASGRAVYWWARTPRRFSRRPSSLARPPLRPRARCFRDASGHARATRSGAKATLRARTRPCIRSASIAIQTRCASSSNRSVLIACRLLSCSRDRRAALGHSTARRPRSATARVERAGAKRGGSERSRRERARASPGRVGTPIV